MSDYYDYNEYDDVEIPSIEALEEELNRERIRRGHSKVLRGIILTLLIVIVAVILVAVLATPILEITGSSMAHTLNNGDIVVSLKTNSFNTGDVIAFQYNNSTQIKRVIARAGDTINIDSSGVVFVNGAQVDEPYVEELALGETDIEYPFTVPDGSSFVMGDHRSTSIDSRNSTVGCIRDEDVEGRILFRFWPLNAIGVVH